MSEILERCWHEDGGWRAAEAAFHRVYCCGGLVHSEFELVGTDGLHGGQVQPTSVGPFTFKRLN